MNTSTNTYYSYKSSKVSTKEKTGEKKVRLWDKVGGDNDLRLRSTKIYDTVDNTIERSMGKTYSKIPMTNAATRDKLLNFVVEDGQFLLEGKIKNGEIRQITKLQGYPVEEMEYKQLGNLALRFCKKIEKYLHR